MQEDTTEPSSDRDIATVMRALKYAIEDYARWPWSSFRQQNLITAVHTAWEVYTSRVLSQAAQIVAGPVETVKAQLGRHERRLADLERRIKALESERSREVGGGDGAL